MPGDTAGSRRETKAYAVAAALAVGFIRHSPDCRLFWGIFRPVEAGCKEIQSVAGCAGGQTVGLAAAKGWSASHGRHQNTRRPQGRRMKIIPALPEAARFRPGVGTYSCRSRRSFSAWRARWPWLIGHGQQG